MTDTVSSSNVLHHLTHLNKQAGPQGHQAMADM